ncbi:transmembrane protein, partial [Thraustotheca clavata]
MDSVASLSLGGPLALQSKLGTSSVCFRLTFAGTKADWISVALSSSQYMVNSPPNNAVVFNAKKNAANVYILESYEDDGMVLQTRPTSINITSASIVNDQISVVFEHQLKAVSANDIAVDMEYGNNVLIWAYGKNFPSYHDNQGAHNIHLASDSSNQSNLQLKSNTSSLSPTYLFVVGGIVVFAAIGLAATRILSRSTTLNRPLLAPPARLMNLKDSIHKLIADLTVGQALLSGLYILLVLLSIGMLLSHFKQLQTTRAASVIAGHLCVLHLAFLMLPVTRGSHWGYLFGVTHNQLLKFHKWIATIFLLTLILHFAINASTVQWNILRSTMPFGSEKVLPGYGLYAGIIFALMGFLSLPPLRHRWYQLFYYFHKVGFLAGIVLIIFHAKAIWISLIAPLLIYVATLLTSRSKAYFNRYPAQILHTTPSTALIGFSAKQKKELSTLAPCSYFYVCIPELSFYEWHPFSAISSPQSVQFAFCVKSCGSGSFTDHIVQLARKEVAFHVLIGGPYGQPSLNLDNYKHVLLFAGGIGITPMLHVINIYQEKASNTNINLCWVVREPKQLLCCSPIMFPTANHVSADFFVSGAEENGSVKTHTGDMIGYQAGRPDIREEMKRFQDNVNVCVIACGPESFLHE